MRRRTRTYGIGKEALTKTRTPRFINKVRDTMTFDGVFSDGTATCKIAVGPYTYENFMFRLISPVSIVGETRLEDGKHVVKSSFFSKYVKRIMLEINGKTYRNQTAEQLQQYNSMMGYDVLDGITFMCFGGPDRFDNELIEDAFNLGTSNLRSLSVLFELTSDWPDTMRLDGMASYTHAPRPLRNLVTQSVQRYTPNLAGEFTIDNMKSHMAIGAIYVLGEGINSGVLEVDDVELYDCSNHQLRAINLLYGKDVTALPAGLVYDFIRSGELGKSLAALTQAGEVKRNADVRMTLDMEAPTEVTVIVDHVNPVVLA